MMAIMRRILRDQCAANKTPLVMSNSGTKGCRRSLLDFPGLGNDDDGVGGLDEDGSVKILSDCSSTKALAL